MREKTEGLNDADLAYQEEIKRYTFDELVDVFHHIDREKLPVRFRIVVHEIKRREGGKLPIQQTTEPLKDSDVSMSHQEEIWGTNDFPEPPSPRQRSTFVTVVAWIFIVFAGFATGISLLQNIMLHLVFPVEEITTSLRNPEVQTQLPIIHQFIFSHIQLFFLSFLGLSGCLLISAIGLLKRKNWARLIFITLLSFGILLNLLGLLTQMSMFASMPTMPPQPNHVQFNTFITVMKIFSFLITIGISVLFGWIIRKLCLPSSKAEFLRPAWKRNAGENAY